MAPQAFIRVRGLEKQFDGKPVLRGVDLDVAEGETVVVLGVSGQGKSVLLRHLNGLLKPDRGEVWVGARLLNRLNEDQLFEVRKQVGMVFQLGGLFDSLTVFENVGYMLREHARLDEDELGRRVTRLLALVELEGSEALYPSQLSGGMQKRVALARALAFEPRAVLYDEPTTGLDPLVAEKINRLIRNLQKQLGFTSVVVTHDLRSAFAIGDRFALLDAGRIRFAGTAEQARASRDQLMCEFLHAAL